MAHVSTDGESREADPYGLDTLTLNDVRARRGVKWSGVGGRLAAWVADMDFPIAPAVRERLVAVASNDVGYANWPAAGRSYLPERFAERMAARFGWAPSVGRLWEVVDVMQGIQATLHHLTERGDGVVLHVPAYYPFLSTIEQMQRRPVAVPAELDGGRWTFDHDALDRRLTREPARVLLLCHPHNPTGHVFTRPELERLAEIADRHDLAVVSDEIHADLVHPGHGHVPFAALGPSVSARTVTVTSASKAFNLAGLRWAILHAGDERLHRTLSELPGHYLGAPNLMAVEATDAAWSEGDGWQRAVGARLDANRHVLAGLLAANLPGAAYAVPDATYLAWIDARDAGLGADPHAALCDRGVELSPGPRFGPQGEGFVRLNFATSPPILASVVAAMAG